MLRNRSHFYFLLTGSLVFALLGCGKDSTPPSSPPSGSLASPSAKVSLPPRVERARAFDQDKPWKDFSAQEMAILRTLLPDLTLPELLSEKAEPPSIEKQLGDFEEFVRRTEEAKKNSMLLQKVGDFKQECLRQFKNPIWSQFPGMARQGGWFQGQIEAEAQKIVDAIAQYHQAKGQAPLNASHNAAARRMTDNWDKVRMQIAAVNWDSASYRPTLATLADCVATLQANDPPKATHAQGVAHPKVAEYREPHLKLAKAVTDKLGVYLERIPFFRLKHYAAAVEARAAGNINEALESATLFIDGDRGIDLGEISPALISIAEDNVKTEVEQLILQAKSIIASLRGKLRPTTEDQAIAMYEAQDLRHRTKHIEVVPGTWCAYSGKYEGKKSGNHLIRMGDVEYVAFATSDDLSNTPDGVRLTIVGQYEKLIEYTRVIGSTGRAPYLKDALVFKQR